MQNQPRIADDKATAPESPLALPHVIISVARYVSVLALASLVLPSIAIAGAPVHAKPLYLVVAEVIAVAVWFSASRFLRTPWLAVVGVCTGALSAWLLAHASYPVAAWVIAPSVGLSAAFVSGRLSVIGRTAIAVHAALVAGAVMFLIAVRLADSGETAILGGLVLLFVAAGARLLGARKPRSRNKRSTFALALGGALLALLTAGYIGATTPSATWFGTLTSHGPRTSNRVAITFDDGPNPPFTLEIARILDEHGAKGTFFTVGKALEARPDVSQALLNDGQLLGNHSYHHDAFRWLDPRYPELEDTQAAFKRTLGVCPVFYRPPHGSHTPFIAREVSDHDMQMVTWDDSAGDWATNDGDTVAKRILDKVQPGSIILLHDGIDGKIGADRSVILTALPQILDGLRERGLEPVTLDTLLGVAPYLPSC